MKVGVQTKLQQHGLYAIWKKIIRISINQAGKNLNVHTDAVIFHSY
jgi:hypothetical protein